MNANKKLSKKNRAKKIITKMNFSKNTQRYAEGADATTLKANSAIVYSVE